MKNKFFIALAFVLIPSGFLVKRHIDARGIPSDLRDAPASQAFTQLGGAAPSELAALPEAKAAAVAEARSQAVPKDWTVMVFINAKNNLELAGLMNVNDMEKVGSTDRVNIVAEFGRMNGQAGDTALDGNWTGVRRYYVTKDKDPERILSPVLQDLGQLDMGDYQNAVNFVRWSKRNFPAKKYLLIMWNHGGGWMTGVSNDDENVSVINAKKIGEILRKSGGADVLAFDACVMQMAEVAYEVKDAAKVVVGSEETIPAIGYPYSIFLSDLAKNPAMDPETLGAAIVDAYGQYYSAFKDYQLNKYGESRVGATLSAIRTQKLPELAARTRKFAALAKASGDKNALKLAKKHVTRYGLFGSDKLYIRTPYADLYSFVKLFSWQLDGKHPDAEAIKQSAEGLMDFISKSLVIKNVALGTDPLGLPLTDSYGISVYMPPASPSMTREKIDKKANLPYSELEFNRQADWLDFVLYMYRLELREGKDLPPQSDSLQFS